MPRTSQPFWDLREKSRRNKLTIHCQSVESQEENRALLALAPSAAAGGTQLCAPWTDEIPMLDNLYDLYDLYDLCFSGKKGPWSM